ncbi:hypothetical protein Tco_0864147 [Tanacetum coccineum]
MSAKDTIDVQHCGLSAKELNEFLFSYPIPSEYDVILPTSTQTIFDAPHGYVSLYKHSFSLANLRLLFTDFFCELAIKPSGSWATNALPIIVGGQEMAFGNFIYTEDDDDLAFLPKEPSLGFGIGSPAASVNTELPKDVEEPEVQHAEITTDLGESSKACVFRGGSARPPVKRKLASGSSSSRVVRAKTSASKDDTPILSIADNDEGLHDCFELKDANASHLKIFTITPPAWKVNKRARKFLQVIEKMSSEADVIKDRERSRKEKCEELQVKCKVAMAEFVPNLAILALREKISSLTADVDSLEAEKAKLEAVKASLRREVKELNQDRRDVVSKVVPYATMELVHSDKLGWLIGTLVSFTITYRRYKAYEQVAAMKEPFDLSKAKGYLSLYKKEHTQASNDFATATFLWLDEFVADVAAPIKALL